MFEDLTDEQLAAKLYTVYNEQGPNPWKTFDGRDVPKFERVGPQVKSKWIAVARYARGKVES